MVSSLKGMVVCPQPIAAEGGVNVLRKGGNAIDAAVTAAFIQGVVDPTMCGIGGFGQINLYMAKSGEQKVIEFHARAGSKVRPDMWTDKVILQFRDGFGYLIEGDVNDIGYQSVMVPGTVAGLYEALVRFGTISWKSAIKPAIKLAKEGFKVYKELAEGWRSKPLPPRRVSFLMRLKATEASRKIYTKNGRLYDVGDILIQKDMAETLTKIGEEGPEVFYNGEVAEKISKDFELNDGFITYSDLTDFKLNVIDPLRTTYRGFEITSIPAPGGGVTLLEILNILEGYDLQSYDWAGLGSDIAEYIHIFAMAMRASHYDRAIYIGDPEFVDVPTSKIISKEWAEAWREKIESGEKIEVPRFSRPEHPSTTHLCVVDREGNVASLTHTLGYCSGVVTPGLGFLYNNAMCNFDPIPNHPNSIAPGKRRVTQMAPTIVYRDGEPFLVLGAPGGGRIVDALAQTIINVIDHGMRPVEAVSAPRISCTSEIIDLSARIPEYICSKLKEMDESICRFPQSYAPFAAVQAILIDRENGKIYGGSDPRRGGAVLST